jgi:methylenetetrahydrofolate dehydrogenase (NADP+)/methenyltetrahydrofolate cyclohydrolase
LTDAPAPEPAEPSVRMGAAELVATRLDQVRAAAADHRREGRPVSLATVLVGDDPGSEMYVSMKQREARELGIDSHDIRLPGDLDQDGLVDELGGLSDRDDIDAILVQYPLPKQLDYMGALLAIDPVKDVDGLHPVSLGLLTAGVPRVVPCTPHGIVDLLVWHGISLPGANVTIVGRGLTVGRPLSILLSAKAGDANASVTLMHTGSSPDDLRGAVERADIVVGAAGSPGLIQPDWLTHRPVLVAAGVAFPEGKAVSDFAPGCRERARAWTPTVGGVGPMTRAWLYLNALQCRAMLASR